jgi:hypothetical protein
MQEMTVTEIRPIAPPSIYDELAELRADNARLLAELEGAQVVQRRKARKAAKPKISANMQAVLKLKMRSHSESTERRLWHDAMIAAGRPAVTAFVGPKREGVDGDFDSYIRHYERDQALAPATVDVLLTHNGNVLNATTPRGEKTARAYLKANV